MYVWGNEGMNAIFSYYFSLTYLTAISLTRGSNKSLDFPKASL